MRRVLGKTVVRSWKSIADVAGQSVVKADSNTDSSMCFIGFMLAIHVHVPTLTVTATGCEPYLKENSLSKVAP